MQWQSDGRLLQRGQEAVRHGAVLIQLRTHFFALPGHHGHPWIAGKQPAVLTDKSPVQRIPHGTPGSLPEIAHLQHVG